jgi:hypothetical protein
MKSIAQVLLERGDVETLQDARILVQEYKETFLEILEEEGPEEAEEWFTGEIGLEPDYLVELIY